MIKMKVWRCWYDTGGAVLTDAHTAEDARQVAEEQAERDGYPGIAVKRVECLSDEED